MFLSRQTTWAVLVFEDEDSGRRVQDELTAGRGTGGRKLTQEAFATPRGFPRNAGLRFLGLEDWVDPAVFRITFQKGGS